MALIDIKGCRVATSAKYIAGGEISLVVRVAASLRCRNTFTEKRNRPAGHCQPRELYRSTATEELRAKTQPERTGKGGYLQAGKCGIALLPLLTS